ncbi:MAG: tetratricopeptide repeat protein [Bacteriovoracaceae bacterium]|nr:tetratricopeptide repeat protein [Bacteriovoracaceae bacterium]
MKLHPSFIPFFLICLFAVGCAHQETTRKAELTDFTPEQLEELNREALVIASKRLEEMVIQAKANQSTVNYLATDLFLKGNMSLIEGDYTTASVLFKHLVTLVPDDEFLQKKFAISLIRVGDLEASMVVLEKLYKKSKEEKVGLILAGVYTGVDKEEEAKKVYRQILAANPKNEDACVFLSKALAMSKENDKAIAQLKACSDKDKKNGMYDYYAGKIYLEMGQVARAMKSFEQANVRQPDLGQAVSAQGIILEEREQHDAAITIYKKYLEKQPYDTGILTRVVQSLFLKERFDEVIPYAERLSDIEPENLNLKVKLGILYTDSKKYPEAISVFKDLLVSAPNSDKILYYLGAIHQEMNEYQASIEYFNQIPSESGLYTDSSVQMANMLSTLAQNEFHKEQGTTWKEKFVKHVNQKLAEFKDMRIEFSVIKSGFYEGIGQYKDAMEAMMVVQDEKNFSTQHKYYLANLYEKEKRFEESTALIMSIIEKEPKNAHAWNFLGYSLLVRGEQMDKAFEYIQTALKISPNDGYIRDSLGWYYFKKGEYGKALAELEMAFKKVPEDVEILKHLATVHKKMKDFSRAKSFLESALKHVRYQTERNEIMSQMEELEGDRLPASGKLD